MLFDCEDYPTFPPVCKFEPGFFHPNVYPDGKVHLSIIRMDCENGWKNTTSIKQILIGIQDLLDDPNFDDPAQIEPSMVYKQSRVQYEERIRAQAREMAYF